MLTGPIPDEIFKLCELAEHDLSHNNLDDSHLRQLSLINFPKYKLNVSTNDEVLIVKKKSATVI
ncbi:hypothetical protein MA16_Dca026566 [Dendrobium catenatum]|uniref:Uncharacterized protein n=1 Tax=Dendrobium catenatum TaxID=906689 RepID=A0A2I0VE25_9ASPA|nr:hypothetical protein MA16_Dca026566 [Dendrobium catenatum]